MTGRRSAGWDAIDNRPRRYVLSIGRDRKPVVHNNGGCAVTQSKMARSLFEQGQFVRMIDVNQHSHVTMIKVSPQAQEPTTNGQNTQTPI